jgi:hypothetical protein
MNTERCNSTTNRAFVASFVRLFSSDLHVGTFVPHVSTGGTVGSQLLTNGSRGRNSNKGNFISKAERIHVDQCTLGGRGTDSHVTLDQAGRSVSLEAALTGSMATGRGEPHTFTETRYSILGWLTPLLTYLILSASRTSTDLQSTYHIIKLSDLCTAFLCVCPE